MYYTAVYQRLSVHLKAQTLLLLFVAGLQMGYFLQQTGRDYVIFEKNSSTGGMTCTFSVRNYDYAISCCTNTHSYMHTHTLSHTHTHTHTITHTHTHTHTPSHTHTHIITHIHTITHTHTQEAFLVTIQDTEH